MRKRERERERARARERERFFSRALLLLDRFVLCVCLRVKRDLVPDLLV